MTTCSSTAAPTNIDMSDIVGTCDLKCNFQMTYGNSACLATNKGDYISLSYDRTTVLPVRYNLVPYYVSEVRIYIKSLHTYDRANADAEYVIIHESDSGAAPLIVCVPVRISTSISESTKIINSVLTTMSKKAPAASDSTTVVMDNYNLKYIVPEKPFFTYTTNTPFQPCKGTVNFIVFSPDTFSCDISQSNYDILSKIVRINDYRPRNGAKVFYNADGPNIGGASDDKIYIDCQPVGESVETEFVVKENKEPFVIDWKVLKTNIYIQILLAAFGFLLVFYIISAMLSAFSTPDANVSQSGGTFRKLGCW
jgi:hypothetical protein